MLARVQEAQPTWRKADLIRHLGELLPDHVACADDGAAMALLVRLATLTRNQVRFAGTR